MMARAEAPPAVSVVMAAHNAETYLAAAVDSILAQDFGDFEFIIVEDGSTDATARMLADYAARDSRVVLVTNAANVGLTRSLNVGLRRARGRYIARMDADDVARPDRLGKQAAFLDANDRFVLVGASVEEIDAAGATLRRLTKPRDDLEMRWMALFYPPMRHPTAMFRADVVRGNGVYYDETCRTAQDYDIWIRLLQHGKGHVFADRLLRYRVHAGNVTATARDDQSATHIRIGLGHLRALYGAGETECAAMRRIYELQLRQDRTAIKDIAPVLATMRWLANRIAAKESLTTRDRGRLRGLAALQAAQLLLVRGRGLTNPAVLAAVIGAGGGLIVPILAETLRRCRRRLSLPLS